MSLSAPAYELPDQSHFDLSKYLAERTSRPSFMVVEFGHGYRPLAFHQGSFTGQRMYVGVEAWMRNIEDVARNELKTLEDKSPHQNVAFIEAVSSRAADKLRKYRTEDEDPYDPRVMLPDNAGDEVFLGNVFGDPYIATSERRTGLLLHEVSRIAASNGVIVIRETVTPEKSRRSLTPEVIASAGLRMVADYKRTDDTTSNHGILWRQLEAVYRPRKQQYWDNPTVKDQHFYLFLSRDETDLASIRVEESQLQLAA